MQILFFYSSIKSSFIPIFAGELAGKTGSILICFLARFNTA